MIKAVLFWSISAVLIYYEKYTSLLISLALYYIIRPYIFSKTYLYHSSSLFVRTVISHCPSFANGYYPTFWLYSGLIHLFFEATLGSLQKNDFICGKVDYRREIIELPDGGIAAIDWAGPKVAKSKKIILIGPGLGNDSSFQYIRNAVLEAIDKGYTVGVLTGRGLSGLPIKTLRIHNACAFDDFGFLIEKVHKRYPKTFLCAMGMSMGSGILLKYAAISGENCPLDAVACVATSFNHNMTARTIDEYWPYFRIPGLGLLRVARELFGAIEDELEQWEEELKERGVDLEHARQVKYFYDFDDKITSRIHGFEGAHDYYHHGSTHYDVDKVRIPVFALNSLDDPIVTPKGIPVEAFLEHEKTILMTTTNGGHVGWFEGCFKVKRWFQVPCIEFFEALRVMKNQPVRKL